MSALLPLVWLRRLIWTLVLALPLQAMAIVSISACARTQAPVPSGTAPQAHAGHHGHEATKPAVQKQKQVHHHGDQQCSVCAAGCVATALLGSSPAVDPIPSHAPLIALAEPASLHIVATPLDRPPRLSRA